MLNWWLGRPDGAERVAGTIELISPGLYSNWITTAMLNIILQVQTPI